MEKRRIWLLTLLLVLMFVAITLAAPAANSEVSWKKEDDLYFVENDYIRVAIDTAHGGALTWLQDKKRLNKDIADNFRIQVILPPEIWVWHGGPGFPPNPVEIEVLKDTKDYVVLKVQAEFMEEVKHGDWRKTRNSEGVTAEITYYFFNSRMFFIHWSVHFTKDKSVRSISIEAITTAFQDWWAFEDVWRGLCKGKFYPGWNWIPIGELAEYWVDAWSNEEAFGEIIMEVNQLEPGRHIYLMGEKPGWTGYVNKWIDKPKGESVEVLAGETFSALMFYTVHSGDYHYMEKLYKKLKDIPFNFVSALKKLEEFDKVAEHMCQLEKDD